MGKIATVGKVSVKVFPDTKDFKNQLREKLKKDLREIEGYKSKDYKLHVDTEIEYRSVRDQAIKHLRTLNRELRENTNYHVRFRATIDQKGQYEAVRKARRELQAHATAWTKANPVKFNAAIGEVDIALNLTKEAKARAKHEIDEWARKVSPVEVHVKPEMLPGAAAYVSTRLAYLTRPRRAEVVPMLNTSAYGGVATALAALSGGRAVFEIGTDFYDTIKDLDKAVPKIASVSLALTNLTGYAMAATSNTLAFASSVASIAPAALALPGVLGGMAVGTGAMVAAFRDFNTVLPEVREQFSKMQDQISARFWEQAEAPMRRLFGTLMPQFTRNIADTGEALGGFFGNLSDSLVGVFDNQLQTMFDGLNRSIDIAATYTDNFAGVIATLGRIGAIQLPRLAGWFGEISQDFDAWLRTAERDGRLQQWVDIGIQNLKELGDVVAQTGRTFAGLARAAEKAGGSSLSMMADTMRSVADTVNSPGFQRAFTRAFEGAHDAMSAISREAGPEFQSLILRITHLLETTLPTAGRTAGKALGAIFDGLDQDIVSDSISGFFDNLERSVDELAPAMPPLGRALASIVDVVGEVAYNVSRVLAPAIEDLSPKIEEMADVIGPLAEVLGDVLSVAVEGLGTVLGPIPGEMLLAGAAMIALRKNADNLSAATGAVSGQFQRGTTWLRQTQADLLKINSTYSQTYAHTGQLSRSQFYLNTMMSNTTGSAQRLNTSLRQAAGGAQQLAGAAGLGLLLTGLSGVKEDAITAGDVLTTSFGGALTGLAVGGPIGALVGLAGGVGLVGLQAAFGDTGEAAEEAKRQIEKAARVEEAKARYESLKSTLDDLTGAYTDLTRETIANNLAETGALDAASRMGIAQRHVIDAVMQGGPAMERLQRAIFKLGQETTVTYDKYGNAQYVVSGLTEDAAALNSALGVEAQNLREAQRETRSFARITQDLSGKLKGVPKDVRIEVREEGVPVTIRGLRKLQREHHLTPKELMILVEAADLPYTKKQLDGFRRDLQDTDREEAKPKVTLERRAFDEDWRHATTQVRDLDEQEAKPKVGLNLDPYYAHRAGLIASLHTIPDETVNIYLNRVGGDGSGGGGGGRTTPRATPRTAPVLDRVATDAERVAQRVADTFTRLTDQVRNQLLSASNGWMNQVRQNTFQIENAIEQVIQQAENKLNNAHSKEAKARARRALAHLKDLAKGWREQGKEIDKAIRKYEQVNNQLQQARAELEAVKAEMQAFKDSLKDSFLGMASVLEAPVASFNSIRNHLQNQVADFTEFHDDLQALMDMGLSQQMIKDLAQAGPQAGQAFIDAILASGQAGVDDLNDLWSQIDLLSGDIATGTGDYVFLDELTMAEDKVDSLLATLQDLQGPINAAAEALMHSIAKHTRAKRKVIVDNLQKIIDKYREALRLMNQATQQNTPGTARLTTSRALTTANTVNDNRVYNINIAARGRDKDDLFAAAHQIKAVIATA